jgi:hypothetical protein
MYIGNGTKNNWVFLHQEVIKVAFCYADFKIRSSPAFQVGTEFHKQLIAKSII